MIQTVQIAEQSEIADLIHTQVEFTLTLQTRIAARDDFCKGRQAIDDEAA